MPAPRKALKEKKRKLSHVSKGHDLMLARLQAIKAKHAVRVQELGANVLPALKEVAAIEDAMELEASQATGVRTDYRRRVEFSGFKLTFEAQYHDAENEYEKLVQLAQIVEVLEGIREDAVAAGTEAPSSASE
jgi:hypothetical protein